MASNYTENYGLCQWEATDQVLREEFNQDNMKIDTILNGFEKKDSTLEELLISQSTAIQKLGNCEISFVQYISDHTYGPDHPTRITFPHRPMAFIVIGYEAVMFSICKSGIGLVCSSSTTTDLALSWSENTVSFYSTANARLQMNSGSNHTYYVLAFYQNDIL